MRARLQQTIKKEYLISGCIEVSSRKEAEEILNEIKRNEEHISSYVGIDEEYETDEKIVKTTILTIK